MKKQHLYLISGSVILATILITALLVNIIERKSEGYNKNFFVKPLSEDIIDPAVWGLNFPHQYEGYKKTSDIERTTYGGSEDISKIDTNPVWKKIFNGYAFGIDYREERGHAYSLTDQQNTLRTKVVQQPGACLQCHAGGMKQIYEKAGKGDLMKGFAEINHTPIQEVWKHTKFPIACTDCHNPETMQLRVTRPGFLEGIKRVKEKEGIKDYNPNTMASTQEMRSYVCGQCHVEYYFKGPEKYLTYPWHKGLKMEEIESYYDEVGHKDWLHKDTGAPVLKAQHPEFELWSQGVHAKSGVSCADCHMPYKREGAMKVSDHHIRSPMLNVSRACLQCHHFTEDEMKKRVNLIQEKTVALEHRAENALSDLIDVLVLAKKNGLSDVQLKEAHSLQRKAQWRLDFISAENSRGFHAPQETARILGESIDYSRQGQIAAMIAQGRK